MEVNSISEVTGIIKKAKDNKATDINCQFATIKKVAIHPQDGLPIIYNDQLNIIARHIKEMKMDEDERTTAQKKYLKALTPQLNVLKSSKKKAKLTRRILKSQKDWNDWRNSEHKQLDQYEAQGMFSEPQQIPKEANSLPFMWTYTVKDDGTKKARAPCNGSPRMQGTVTLGETYAASLDHTAARIFWALTATSNHVTIGADASNAFAEAPAPIAPLYMSLDAQFHSWWKSKGRPPIPQGYGVRVHKAIQGHP